MALQHAIDRSQRGNRLDALLCELLLDRRSTPVLATLSQHPAQLDDALFNPLSPQPRLVPRLGAQSLCPCRSIRLVARFPFVEPAFCTVQVAAKRFEFIPRQIPHDGLFSPLCLSMSHDRPLIRLIVPPSMCYLFSMLWHNSPSTACPRDSPGSGGMEGGGAVFLKRRLCVASTRRRVSTSASSRMSTFPCGGRRLTSGSRRKPLRMRLYTQRHSTPSSRARPRIVHFSSILSTNRC